MTGRLIGKRLLCLGVLTVVAVAAAIAGQATSEPATRPANQAATQPADRPATQPTSQPSRDDSSDAGKMTPVDFQRLPDGELRAVLKGDSVEEAEPLIAHMRLSGEVLSAPPEFCLFADSASHHTLREWLQRLAKARKDDRITAVALEIDSPRMSWAQGQELADAIRRLDAVKPVCAHLVSGGAVAYLVASAGREVAMEPAGTLEIVGLGAELMFFRGTLDWLGIQPQFIQIGRFKGADEPMTRTGPSKEAVGELNKILDDLFDQLCGQIARQRKLTVPHVRHVIDHAPLDAESALKYKLVDSLIPRVDWREHLAGKFGEKEPAAEIGWMEHYACPTNKALDASNPWQLLSSLLGGAGPARMRDPTIAIVHAEGMIVSGEGGGGLFGQRTVGSSTMERVFRSLAENDHVKAVVLRIDSPGGGALASERIFQAVRKCAEKKPVIASILGTGASGGYYIALGARKIVADPSAIVGSIGVVSGKLAITGLMEKLGISTWEITRGKNAGLRMSRAWKPAEKRVMRRLAQRTYDLFARRVGESRAGKVKDVSQVAQGRVFTARQAVKNGLIDSLGGLREAITMAQKAAGIRKAHFITLPRSKTLADVLFGGGIGAATPAGVPGAVGRLGRTRTLQTVLPAQLSKNALGLVYLLNLAERLDRETVLTAMPYWLSIRY